MKGPRSIARRYVILAEGRLSSLGSKTANAALLYIPEQIVAVVDSTKQRSTTQEIVGLGGDIPIVHSIEEAMGREPDTLLVGIAPVGGQLPEDWRPFIRDALERKLSVISGLHQFLSTDPEFRALARANGAQILDLRKVPSSHNIIAQGSWRRRTAKTILTVGTDSNIGKLTTSLLVYKEMKARGINAAFVGTGQTGILVGGRGVAADAVIADFLAGAVEYEVDRAANEEYEYIIIEGQGALTHCGFSGITLGIMHGAMPDALILCHQPTREVDGYGLPLIPVEQSIALHEGLLAPFKPAKVVGIGINSIGMNKDEIRILQEEYRAALHLTAVDPLRHSAAGLVDAILAYFSSYKPVLLTNGSSEIRDRIF